MACLKRDAKSLEEHGENQEVEWKPDSSAIAVTVCTSIKLEKCLLLIMHFSLDRHRRATCHFMN